MLNKISLYLPRNSKRYYYSNLTDEKAEAYKGRKEERKRNKKETMKQKETTGKNPQNFDTAMQVGGAMVKAMPLTGP